MPAPRPPLLCRLLDRLPQAADPWQDAPDAPAGTDVTAGTGVTAGAGSTTLRPVVLVHGTAGSRGNFERIVPALRESGRPVLSVSYGHRGTGGLCDSLEEVTGHVSRIVETHGPVDLVGHSQGGLLALASSGRLDAGAVRHVVGLAADFRGVARPWFRPPEHRVLHRLDRAFSPALADQLVGSPVLREVLAHTVDSTVPVTQVITRGDWIVPRDRALALGSHDTLTGLDAHRGPLRFVTIQDRFPDARISHAVIPHHRIVGTLVVEALDAPPGAPGT
ncbi:esterase/lipase family protein [Corynebacterium sp. AOP40-9SA-29]|uniref:esterase/lipase family protein n=1 Tax=Corynebacterium sp. AOP40-9SA-29 TaxID=3457677 RepID=UPI0040334981